MINTVTQTQKKTISLVRIGMLSALSFILMIAELYIGFAEYLKLDFSDIVAMIGGITMGPLAAVAIQIIKNMLKAIIITRTAGIGELANVIVGIAYVLPATLIFRKIKTNKGLVYGLIAGSITMIIVACIANYFVLLPLYWSFISQEAVSATAKLTYIQVVIFPFNLLKALIVSSLTLVVHLTIKPLYRYLVG